MVAIILFSSFFLCILTSFGLLELQTSQADHVAYQNTSSYGQHKVCSLAFVWGEHSFLPFSQNLKFLFSSNWKEWEGMDFGLMKILLKLLKYPFNLSRFYTSQNLFFCLNQSYKITQLSFLHYCSHCYCCSSLLLLCSSQYCYCSVSFFFINCPIDSLQMIICYYFSSSLLVYFFVSQSASLSISLSASIIIIIIIILSITPIWCCQFSLSICLLLLYFYHATIVSIMPLYVFILRHFRISIKPCHFMYFYNSISLVLFVYMSTTFHSANKKKTKKNC